MAELWQLYDEQGQPLRGKGAVDEEIFSKALLHGAGHMWIWRMHNGVAEILLQKRSATKRTWPNLYDISAAGHINLGEEPLAAALRETQEEIGLAINPDALKLISVQRVRLLAPNGSKENELQWVYLYRANGDADFTMQVSEVASVEWKPLDAFETEVIADENGVVYVAHGMAYYETIIDAIKFQIQHE